VSERIDNALAFATKKHEGQFRKGGEPYISHPQTVSQYVREWGCDEDTQIAALFHDLLEDTDATEQDILSLGGKNVLHAVKLLTKRPDYRMAEYMAAIVENPMAKKLKSLTVCIICAVRSTRMRHSANGIFSKASSGTRRCLKILSKRSRLSPPPCRIFKKNCPHNIAADK